MAADHVQPMPGRRPVYPVDSKDEGPGRDKTPRHESVPPVAPEGSAEDPAADHVTDSANHPNDE